MQGPVRPRSALLGYTSRMSLFPVLSSLLSRASRALGLESLSAFPPGHQYARTHWDPAWFDIPSDMKPDRIEAAICDAIAATPAVFAHIVHPTPRMQRTLLGAIHAQLRRGAAVGPGRDAGGRLRQPGHA
jgi:hypothetical protein